MQRPSPRKILWSVVTLTLAGALWITFGPRQLGGTVSYVITHGISMQPRFKAGDLVIMREADAYGRGDVIAYASASLKQPVMHRIVDGDPAGYVTKGDNNDWLDSDRPSDADVIGKEWLHISGGGRFLRQVISPTGAATLAGIAGLLLFAGRRGKSRSNGRRGGTMRSFDLSRFDSLSPSRRVAAGGLAVLCIASVALGVFAYRRDPIRTLTGGPSYAHTGVFAYAASAPKGPVYPDGLSTTAEPLFLKLVDDVRVSFTYRFESDAQADVRGAAIMWARITDGTGWRTSFRLQGETEFDGNAVEVSGTIDPKNVIQRITEVQQNTGVITSDWTLTLMPAVSVTGTVEGRELTERFNPTLDFALTSGQMKLGPTATADQSGGVEPNDPLRPRLEGELGGARQSANELSLFGLDVPVRGARGASLLGFVVSLAGLWMMWRITERALENDEAAEIAAHYGQWMIPVAGSPSMGTSVRVASMDGLVKLADRYERMILHANSGGTHRYSVEESGVHYFYEVAASKPRPASAAPEAPKDEVAPKSEPRTDDPAPKSESRKDESAPVRKVRIKNPAPQPAVATPAPKAAASSQVLAAIAQRFGRSRKANSPKGTKTEAKSAADPAPKNVATKKAPAKRSRAKSSAQKPPVKPAAKAAPAKAAPAKAEKESSNKTQKQAASKRAQPAGAKADKDAAPTGKKSPGKRVVNSTAATRMAAARRRLGEIEPTTQKRARSRSK